MGRAEYLVRTRRGFLHSAVAVGAGVTAGGFADVFGSTLAQAAGSSGEVAATILNLAATAEGLVIAFYRTALGGATFHIDEQAVAELKMTWDVEVRHLRMVQSLGGSALQQRFYLPERMLSDASVFVATGIKLETALAGAYIAATRRFAEFGRPELAGTAAALGASEAQHLTVLHHLAGLPPHQAAHIVPSYRRATEAASVLAPFLEGGTGYSGPVSAGS